MIALAVAIVVASVLAWHVAGVRTDQRHAERMEALQLERDRFEATRPVAPHEEIVAKVQALESRLNAVESWAKR